MTQSPLSLVVLVRSQGGGVKGWKICACVGSGGAGLAGEHEVTYSQHCLVKTQQGFTHSPAWGYTAEYKKDLLNGKDFRRCLADVVHGSQLSSHPCPVWI